jgi:hypothetical protein
MNVERLVYEQIKRVPWLKNTVRTLYQSASLPWLGKKVRCNRRLVIRAGFFFGFHDKTPWCPKNTKVLAHRVIGPFDPNCSLIRVGYFADRSLHQFIELGETKAWSKQQGAQLQWCGDNGDIIYNVRQPNGRAGAVRKSSCGQLVSEYDYPVGAVDGVGRRACIVEFGAFGIGMQGYGLGEWAEEIYRQRKHTDPALGLTEMDLRTGALTCHFTLPEVVQRVKWHMRAPWHYFISHAVYSPGGRHLAFFVRRSAKGHRVQTRLCILQTESGHLITLPGGTMASHYCWLDEDSILAFLETEQGVDRFQEFSVSGEAGLSVAGLPERDGHPQFSLVSRLLVLDSYPNRRRRQQLNIYERNDDAGFSCIDRMEFYSPMRFRNDDRVDLHPRWDRIGEDICIDASFNGERSLAVLTDGHIG